MNKKDIELELWKDWKYNQNGDARNQLISSLTPLLSREVNKFSGSPLPRTAIESEARVLATKALDTYDPNKAQLNTHVVNNLKHLQRYVLTYQNIGKIPEHRGIAIGRYNSTFDNLKEDLGREPNIAELSDELKWPIAEVERMQSELRKDLNIMTKQDDAEDSSGFFDYTPIEKTEDIKTAIEFAYYDASPEDKKILEYTFGMGGNPILPADQIALKINRPALYVKTHLKNLAQKIRNAEL